MNTLGNKLTALRRSKGLTQQELAEKINYSDKVISKWERGESIPNIMILSTLAKFYNITIDELLQDTDIVTTNNCQADKNVKTNGYQINMNYLVRFIFAFMQFIIFFFPFLSLIINGSSFSIIISGYETLFRLTPESFIFVIVYITIWVLFLINIYFSVFFGVNCFSGKNLITYKNMEKTHKILYWVFFVLIIILFANIIFLFSSIRIGYYLFFISLCGTLWLYFNDNKKSADNKE